MRTVRISSGGQISVPADVRRRWKVARVGIEDRGDHLVLRPLPDDPIAAAEGALVLEKDVAEVRADYRLGEAGSEERRIRRSLG